MAKVTMFKPLLKRILSVKLSSLVNVDRVRLD